MDIAAEVVELFTTRDAARAQHLAEKLEQLNTDRRATRPPSCSRSNTAWLPSPSFLSTKCSS